jgi:hypothetical protein
MLLEEDLIFLDELTADYYESISFFLFAMGYRNSELDYAYPYVPYLSYLVFLGNSEADFIIPDVPHLSYFMLFPGICEISANLKSS